MVYKIGIIGFFFAGFLMQEPASLHHEVRNLYFQGWKNECGAKAIVDKLKNVDLSDDVVIMAYRGAAETTLANCVSAPWKKMEHFNSGKKELETAVRKLPDNFEIRVIRFTVQSNVPSFLDYDNIEEDKRFILKSLSLQLNIQESDNFLTSVIEFLLNSAKLTVKEKEELKSLKEKM